MLCQGSTRTVLLTSNYAFKFPALNYGWRNFLQGLLANQQEHLFSKAKWPELCPVLFYIPGGFLVVMPKARKLTDIDFAHLPETLFGCEDYVVPVENKQSSFGWLNGKIVVVDYGS